MPKKRKGHAGLADPTRLQPHDAEEEELFHVIIETPKGSRNKDAFDSEQKGFALKKVLPAGMMVPYVFGLIPSTKAEDGDPTDALVLMDEPALPGCLLKCRLIGIIEGEQHDKKKSARNDRMVAVQKDDHGFAHVRHIDDLDRKFIRELEEFFLHYHDRVGLKYRILDVKGPGKARGRIADGMKAARR